MNNHTPHDTELTLGALVDCPTCGLPAEVTDLFTLGGAPGPVEHAKIICVRRHWYTLPLETLTATTAASERTSASAISGQR